LVRPKSASLPAPLFFSFPLLFPLLKHALQLLDIDLQLAYFECVRDIERDFGLNLFPKLLFQLFSQGLLLSQTEAGLQVLLFEVQARLLRSRWTSSRRASCRCSANSSRSSRLI